MVNYDRRVQSGINGSTLLFLERGPILLHLRSRLEIYNGSAKRRIKWQKSKHKSLLPLI